MHLIKNRGISHDDWLLINRDIERLLRPGEDGLLPDFPDKADMIVPTALWRLRREDLLDRRGATGVWLDSHEHPEVIAADLHVLPVVGVNFAVAGDERGCVTARLLRERYGYRGELRAIGEVPRDRLHVLSRYGFDAFAMCGDQNGHEAPAGFEDYGNSYAPTIVRASPARHFRDAQAGRKEKAAA